MLEEASGLEKEAADQTRSVIFYISVSFKISKSIDTVSVQDLLRGHT